MALEPLEPDASEQEAPAAPPQPSGPRVERLSRKTLVPTIALLIATAALCLMVGRQPSTAAPATTLPVVGRIDQATFTWAQRERYFLLADLALAINLIGSGAVTIPLRALVGIFFVFRRRWLSTTIWLTTWLLAESSL